MKISIVTPVFNERYTAPTCIEAVRDVLDGMPYDYEHILCDNASTDETQKWLRYFASVDKHVKVIFNSQNYGAERSGFNGILAAIGNAIVVIPADCQDPPEMIPEMVRKWQAGAQVVSGVKTGYLEVDGPLLTCAKMIYYWLLNVVSDVPIPKRVADFKLIDKSIQEQLRKWNGIHPSLRVMIAQAEVEHRSVVVYKVQPRRAGKSKGTGHWGTLFAHAINDFRVALHRPKLCGPVVEVGRLNF